MVSFDLFSMHKSNADLSISGYCASSVLPIAAVSLLPVFAALLLPVFMTLLSFLPFSVPAAPFAFFFSLSFFFFAARRDLKENFFPGLQLLLNSFATIAHFRYFFLEISCDHILAKRMRPLQAFPGFRQSYRRLGQIRAKAYLSHR